MTITYLAGDATKPIGEGTKIIVHCVNNIGAWGAGFVLAISRRWPEPKATYADHSKKGLLGLGTVHFVPVGSSDIVVANLVGQKGIRGPNNPTPISYSALETGLNAVAEQARKLSATVHMPRIGCGLAGGEWSKVEAIVNKTLVDIDVCVYDF